MPDAGCRMHRAVARRPWSYLDKAAPGVQTPEAKADSSEDATGAVEDSALFFAPGAAGGVLRRRRCHVVNATPAMKMPAM